MFALGIVYWMFSRPMEQTENFLKKKFAKAPEVINANIKVLHSGYNYAETIEALPAAYTVLKADIEKGNYRNIMGNQATAWGLLAAAEKSKKELFLGSYPITPATDILHELAKYKNLRVKTFQAEDEIAGICSAIGASFAGALAVTTTSGPGVALKAEALGLAMIAELPLVVIDVQRGGPSTGLPTKTEQSDLFQALYGRNGESPVIVIAASTPANCFDWAYEASKLALEHNTPVVLLSDGYLGNGAQPWKIKSVKDMPNITPLVAEEGEEYQPYARSTSTLARRHAIPGTPGLEHRLGGLEKDFITGNVSYDPENHQEMSRIRKEKVEKVTEFIPKQKVFGDEKGDLLIVGWGGTYGHLYSSVKQLRKEGKSISLVQFNYINPLPKNTADILKNFKKIVVCEINNGQFVNYLRMKHPKFKYQQFNRIQGLPFQISDLKKHFNNLLS
jgi:2-oxoglutarate ferredoxin oxidoreductase subunit alpha